MAQQPAKSLSSFWSDLFNIKVIKMYFPLYKMLIIMWENACYNLVNKIDTQRRGTTYPNKRNLTLPKVVGSVAVL